MSTGTNPDSGAKPFYCTDPYLCRALCSSVSTRCASQQQTQQTCRTRPVGVIPARERGSVPHGWEFTTRIDFQCRNCCSVWRFARQLVRNNRLRRTVLILYTSGDPRDVCTCIFSSVISNLQTRVVVLEYFNHDVHCQLETASQWVKAVRGTTNIAVCTHLGN